MTSLNSFSLIRSYWRPTDSRNVRLAVMKKQHLEIPPADDGLARGMVHTVQLRDMKDRFVTYCRVADDPNYQSTFRVNITADQKGDEKPKYCVEMENGTFQPLTDIVNEFDSKPIIKKFEQFEQACKDAGFPAFHAVTSTNIQRYALAFEDNYLFSYSGLDEERVFYKFNEESSKIFFKLDHFSGLKEESIEKALDLYTADIMIGSRAPEANPFFMGQSHYKGQMSSQSYPSRLDSKPKKTSLESQRSYTSVPYGYQMDQPKSMRDCKKSMTTLIEGIMTFLSSSLNMLLINWKAMAHEAKIHANLEPAIQTKLNTLANKSLRPLKWFEARWVKPLIAVLDRSAQNTEDPRTKRSLLLRIEEIEECFTNASKLCSLVNEKRTGELAGLSQDLPLHEFSFYVEETKIGYSEYEYTLFDSIQLREIISAAMDNPDVLLEFQALQESEFKTVARSLLKKRLPERSDARNCERWDEKRKPVITGFQLGGMVINSLKNNISRSLEVLDTRSSKVITKIPSGTAHNFHYSGYLVSIEHKQISWRKLDYPDSESDQLPLLGMGHWTKPFKIDSRIFYLCHDQQRGDSYGEYEIKVNLIMIDIAPLTKGNAPLIQKYCEVLTGIRATCCDLVASDNLIAVSVDSFMGDRFLCIIPNERTTDEDQVKPVVLNLKETEPFKIFAEENSKIKGDSFHLEIKAMQFYGDQLFVVMDDLAEEGTKQFKYLNLRWNYATNAFDLLSTLSVKDELYGQTPYHDLNGFFWLEHKTTPYILYFNGPNTIKVVTMHQKKLVDISKRKAVQKAFKKEIPELLSNMSFCKNSTSAKSNNLNIYSVTSTLSTRSPIVTKISLQVKLR